MEQSYEQIISSDVMCVLSDYKHIVQTDMSYESETALENKLIAQLSRQGISSIDVTNVDELQGNAREQLSKLNNHAFSDAEWKQVWSKIADDSMTVTERSRIFHRGDGIFNIEYDDDDSRENFKIIDKMNLHNNILQVTHQYVPSQGHHRTRYDVTILVNGIPLVHIELKRRGISLKEAFNQIARYSRDSFWSASDLFGWVQLFVISNGTHTRYFSNTTYEKCMEKAEHTQTFTGSYAYAFMWTDARNKAIDDLVDFTATFLTRGTLLNILTKYCVFTESNSLMVMRPYQIAATERVLARINVAVNNPERLGKVIAGGYVWHTTGSGKTLTSFKCAQLAADMSGVDKVLFVVDRRDLDDQTMIEYEKFQKGAVSGATSSKVLEDNLNDDLKPIHVTTIQKLMHFMKRHDKHEVFSKTVVFIFDECHRSHFGDMHRLITRKFKKYILFGFTGTPIFAENAAKGVHPDLVTTEQAFGERLHTYTIVPAISAGAVLKFKVETIGQVVQVGDKEHRKVSGIQAKKAMHKDQRIELVSKYILDNFGRHTKRASSYVIKLADGDSYVPVVRNGFNALFATDSIEASKLYYAKFKKLQEGLDNPLKIALIYTFSANGDSNDPTGTIEEGDIISPKGPDRDFLEAAMADYNMMFNTSFDCESGSFERYYRDVSNRMKSRELDLLIVVDMFLTGFDAKCLNTLFVDKNLRMHGLIQAFSRTNRPLDAVKSFGNIVCFRDLDEELNEAIALFADEEASGVVLCPPYKELLKTYREALDRVRGMVNAVGALDVVGETQEKEFIGLWSSVLRTRNILSTFDEFEADDDLSDRELQNRNSDYCDLRDKYVHEHGDAEDISEDLDFEMELVRQVEVSIDYILHLVDKYRVLHKQDIGLLADIRRAVESSPTYRDRQELIEAFIASVNADGNIDDEWHEFLQKRLVQDFETLIEEEDLDKDKAKVLMQKSWDAGHFDADGRGVSKLVRVTPPKHLSPMEQFKWLMMSKDGGESVRETRVREVGYKLLEFFERYFGLVLFEVV